MFNTVELQILDNIGVQNTPGTFKTPLAGKNFACRVHNGGMEGAYLVFGESAEAVNHDAGASGKQEFYIPAGESRDLDKGPAVYFAACTDNGATKLYLEAGKVT